MDFTPILLWWFVLFIFGLAGWPLAFKLLRHLPDRGFAFARPVGLLLTGYILWLGGTFRLLPNNTGGVIVALGIVLAVGLVWQRQGRGESDLSWLGWLRQEWRYALFVELLFSLAFAGWAVFKAYNPDIETAGGEKWMEIAFINGTLASPYFPPQDPWLSGFAISYYYFGYVLMAMVTRLTGLVSTVAFNLYIPTLFALTLTAALSIVANLVSLYRAATAPAPAGSRLGLPSVATGFAGALFVAVLGNLEGLLEVFHKASLLPAGFWAWLDIRDLKIPPVGSGLGWIPDRFMWWWRASRVLTDYTLSGYEQEVIDEFPFFSFLLGDVHPHVLALPFVLLVVALGLNLLANQRAVADGQRSAVSGEQPAASNQPVVSHQAAGITAQPPAQLAWLVDELPEMLQHSWRELTGAVGGRLAFGLYALCLGSLSFLNTWDFPIYLTVVGLSLIVWLAYRRQRWTEAIWPGLIGTAMLGLAGLVLFLPFYATFQSQARGLLPNLWNPTRLPQFFVFFGPFLVAAVALLLVLAGRTRRWRRHLGWSLQLTLLGPVLVMLLALVTILISPAGRDYIQGILNSPEVQQVIGGEATIGSLVQVSLLRRLASPWTFLLLGGLLGWTLALLIGVTEEAPELDISFPVRFVLILLLVGLVLPLSVEFVYLRDNFGIRMNTIFKFYFQAWVLLALAAAFAVYYVFHWLRGLPAVAWGLGLALLVAGGLVYPALATPNKADYFQRQPTLNGIAWIASQQPADYAAIEWLRANAPAGAVILEAPGVGQFSGYNYSGRISAMTGLPTLLGWGNHESQWRGNYDEPGRREPDIQQLYSTLDLQQARLLLDKYHIKYVYVGSLERERYSPQGLKKFERLMEPVFQQGDVIIYGR